MPGTPQAFCEEIVDRPVRERTRPLRVREKVPWEEQHLIPIPRAAIQGTGPFSGKWPLSVIFPIPPMHLDPCLLADQMRKSRSTEAQIERAVKALKKKLSAWRRDGWNRFRNRFQVRDHHGSWVSAMDSSDLVIYKGDQPGRRLRWKAVRSLPRRAAAPPRRPARAAHAAHATDCS